MKPINGLISIWIVFVMVVITQGQGKMYPMKEYLAQDSSLYWNKKLPLYLKVASTPDGEGILLNSKEQTKYVNPIFLDTEGPNFFRTRYAVDQQTLKTVEPPQEILLEVIADGTPPVSTVEFSGAPLFTKGADVYFGPGLKTTLTSKDQLSGVATLDFSTDGQNFFTYQEPLLLQREGAQELIYYSVDHVGNKETPHTSLFIIDLTPPTITHNVNGIAGEKDIAATSTIYFTATDNLSGVAKIWYRFDEETYKIYQGNKVDFMYLPDGPHTLEYYSIDEVNNESAKNTFEFYFDKTAPLTTSDVLGDRFVVQNRIYFSGRTKMKLTAIDNRIGVKEILYSIDDREFIPYAEPFYLPSVQGNHTIRFYSVDRLANAPSGAEAYKHNLSLVYVDLTGPDVKYNYIGATFQAIDKFYISPRTMINLSAQDKESGLQYISYSLDGSSAEVQYDQPFTVNASGAHRLELFGYDNVNNRNLAQTNFFVDAEAPDILPNFSAQPVGDKDGLPVYPAYTTLFLAATDALTGSDRIYYRINEKAEQLYTAPLRNFNRNQKYSIVMRALDMVGNEATKTIHFYTSEK